MTFYSFSRIATLAILTSALAGCGGGLFPERSPEDRQAVIERQNANIPGREEGARNRSTIWDLFNNDDDPNTTVAVNKYIWQASLEILNFLPIQSVDPFSGVIVTGYGTPPGGGRAYRATVYVQDPALDARSLKLALNTRGGPVDAATTRAVEDAILTRARQLRIRDSKL
ncbi:DUF3576 domain-containing protein [Rhodovulum adriaticum]|uniref:Uncharacterized protein DUF3576 n=1 Tax=Rhodovulum adriaticum TaxID=35804 RepID=A0A4R2NYL1_RHOAD|nr:DUF3576 domain-containing protein [Rhodovulum adriaticum]MBK1634250.1 hypothetical protein [Rhodovulum adriaticum]TCP27197.1 uncharacterized protein DUF3576 [Rhodovulum adriaticum]